MDSEKSRLRRNASFVLGTMGPDQFARAGERVAEHLAHTREFAAASSVALFAATEEEVGTRPIFDAAVASGKCCVFPRCIKGQQLEFAVVEHWDELEPGRFGIFEPKASAAKVDLAEVDLVLVPGVAFDRRGGRLGHGAGYYDRTLAKIDGRKPFLIGVAHSVQLFDVIPMDTHDRRVDAVALETGVVRVDDPRGSVN